MTLKEFAEQFQLPLPFLIHCLSGALGTESSKEGWDENRLISQAERQALLTYLQNNRQAFDSGELALSVQVRAPAVSSSGIEIRRKRRVIFDEQQAPVIPVQEPEPVVIHEPVNAEPLTTPPELSTLVPPPVELEDSSTEQKRKKKKERVEETEVLEKGKKSGKEKRTVRDFETELSVDIAVDDPLIETALEELTRPQPKAPVKKYHKTVDRKFVKPPKPVTQKIRLGEHISVADLAQKMLLKVSDFVRQAQHFGFKLQAQEELDQSTASLLVDAFGHQAVLWNAHDLETECLERISAQDAASMMPRPPVVTIMGHVDHGKTSLLDAIRSTRMVDQEAGGITQRIGAYQVHTPAGAITFLDTPGHAVFTGMRARGARCTDIVILVVAADDGVMPQTLEAIQHARAAEVPLIVAITKIDKPGADLEKVKSELAARDVLVEEWGGDIQSVPVSAKTGAGLDALLEAINLQAEMMGLQAPVEAPARGTIIEASIEKGRGPVVTVLVQAGTLKRADYIVVGLEQGRVRAMLDDQAKACLQAPPSMPVVVLGLSGIPSAGDALWVVPDEKTARDIVAVRLERQRKARLAQDTPRSATDWLEQMNAEEVKSFSIILKTDVQGSLEAILQAIRAIASDEVECKVISSGVGPINESDVKLAMASNAMIVAFNVRAENAVKALITQEGVIVHSYTIIYELLQAVRAWLTGYLKPEEREEKLGAAQVREVFKVSKSGMIAGCMVLEGIVKRNVRVRVMRHKSVIFEGELESLKRFKDDVSEVKAGFECGLSIKNCSDLQPGDALEFYKTVQVARVLDA